MFYNNRAKLFRRGRTTSLFPNKNIKLSRNLNKDIIQNTTHNLAAEFTSSQFFALPGLSPYIHLEGYFIEGWWGESTNSVSIKKVDMLFKQYNLDLIIAIVPVTYYLPPTNSESSGFCLYFIKDKLLFSATYAILLFQKNKNGLYKKTYSSIKQVYVQNRKNPVIKDKFSNTYEIEHLVSFYNMFEDGFLPHLSSQLVMFFKDPRNKHVFVRPVKPWYYSLPH